MFLRLGYLGFSTSENTLFGSCLSAKIGFVKQAELLVPETMFHVSSMCVSELDSSMGMWLNDLGGSRSLDPQNTQ